MANHTLIDRGSEAIAMFCRLNINKKSNLPIRASEMGLLILISKSTVNITPIIAADFFRVSKPRLTAMTNSLVKKGYLIKKPRTDDQRSHYLVLTKKGTQLVSETYATYSKNMAWLIDKMGEEKYKEMIELIGIANEYLGGV